MGSTLILPAAGQSRTAATGAGSGAMTRYYVRKGVHYGTADEMIDYIDDLEAKLAKAVEALDDDRVYGVITHTSLATLTELKGEK